MIEKNKSSELTIEGRKVETNIFPGEIPYASNAEFYFKNNAEDKEITVVSVEFKENENISRLETYYLYNEDRVLHKKFLIPANGNLHLKISFPFISVKAGRNDTYEVKAKFKSGAHEYEAISKLLFTFEI